MSIYEQIDSLYLAEAARIQRFTDSIRCTGMTTGWEELLYVNRADFTAYASSATEGSLIGGQNEQPTLPALFFDGAKGFGRSLCLYADGILGTTASPTIIFQVRLGSTIGTTSFAGASVGVSTAITAGTGVTNKRWHLYLFITCNTPGQGSGNTTLNCNGFVQSDVAGAFATAGSYPLEPTTPDTATWTQTIDNSVTQYFNVSATWSASSASNTVTCKHCLLHVLN